jgi:hypothetical protein
VVTQTNDIRKTNNKQETEILVTLCGLFLLVLSNIIAKSLWMLVATVFSIYLSDTEKIKY